MSKLAQERVGTVFTNNHVQTAKVVEYRGSRDVLIEFEDGTQISKQWSNLKWGGFINPNDRPLNIYGGRLDAPRYQPSYQRWIDMLRRAYCPKYKALNPSYADVTVCKEWLLYSNFHAWYIEQEAIHGSLDGLQLDKDLSGSRQYSPESCQFISQVHNVTMSRVRDIIITMIHPDHGEHTFRNQRIFAKVWGLDHGNLSAVIHGKHNQHKGWTLISKTDLYGNPV